MSLTSLTGIELPVIQAPMAGVQDEALALAVSAAGGLGSMPCAMLDAAGLERALGRLQGAPSPVNLNFFCHAMADPDPAEMGRWHQALAPYFEEYRIDPPPPNLAGARRPIDEAMVEVMEPYRPQVLSFHFGLPSPGLLHRIKGWGARILASATTLEEGRWLERNGADLVIAQGIEAGGHRGHFLSNDLSLQLPTRRLLAHLLGNLSVPVIAAGGIADRRDAAALLEAGACAVQVGTAYLLCPEATTSAVHRAALEHVPIETALTNLFSGRPARGIVNRLMRELGSLSDLPPAFPWASPALAPLRSQAEAAGRGDFSPLWSGTKPPLHGGASAATVTLALAGRP